MHERVGKEGVGAEKHRKKACGKGQGGGEGRLTQNLSESIHRGAIRPGVHQLSRQRGACGEGGTVRLVI